MKRFILALFTIMLSFSLAACTKNESVMTIKTAELTEEESDLLELVKGNTQVNIYDFEVNDTIKSIEISIHKLKQGKWENLSKTCNDVSSAGKGKLVVSYQDIKDNVEVAIQTKEKTVSTTYFEGLEDVDYGDMLGVTTTLAQSEEIIPGKEIPLVIQVYTSKSEVTGLNPDSYYESEKLMEHDNVYAITVLFSESENTQQYSDTANVVE